MLRKYVFNLSHVLTHNPLELREDLTYKEELEKILASEEKVLQRKNIAFVKVLWRNHSISEATWEQKELKAKYLNSLTLTRKCASK